MKKQLYTNNRSVSLFFKGIIKAPDLKKNQKHIMFSLFNGVCILIFQPATFPNVFHWRSCHAAFLQEVWDYIGSSRMVYDMMNGKFPDEVQYLPFYWRPLLPLFSTLGFTVDKIDSNIIFLFFQGWQIAKYEAVQHRLLLGTKPSWISGWRFTLGTQRSRFRKTRSYEGVLVMSSIEFYNATQAFGLGFTSGREQAHQLLPI